ncbi:MAG: FprA family A-type flavoprotein, partial [Peptococcaceae bacterium]|nr:FprA family A-type flavoprotein [Peptococcaceae bacterium]
ERSYSNRTVAFMENGSWAPVAAKWMKAMLEKSKNLTYTENNVTILSALNEASTAQVKALAVELCK